MKKMFPYLIVVFLVAFSGEMLAQSNTVDYVFKIRYKKEIPFVGTVWLTTTVDSGSFNEGQPYVVPDFNVPGDIAVIQNAYNAIVGSVFLLDDGAIDEDLFLEMILDGLDTGTGAYVPAFDEKLFFDMTVNVYAGGSTDPYQGHYYFNSGKYLWFKIPITSQFINFVITTLQFDLNDLGFAFIEDDGFEGSGISTVITADTAAFRAEHLSKFGGGRGHISTITGIGQENKESVPSDYELEQNYPNPFNPSTTIKYALPKDGFVELKVYDVLGNEVATLISENQSAAKYEVKFDANDLSSGIYLYTLRVNNRIITKKMMLIK